MSIENGLGSSQMNWCGLFAANESHSLRFFPALEDGEIKIKPLSEVFDAGIKVWGNSLVAQFLGKPPSSSSLVRLVNLIWGKFGEIVVNPAGENLFLFQFPSLESRDWVLANGPWHIQNKPIILRKWEPNLKSLDFSMEKLSVWVHLSGVPLELFNNVGFSYVTSALGTPLYMDGITANRQRLAYAKVCVEMSADFKIPSFISVMLRDGTYASVGVKVPWLPVSDVVSVPGGPSEVAGPVSGVVVPTATVIVEGTTASTSGNEGPLDLGVVQTPITGERGKAPLESIDEHRPIREAAKNVAVMMQGLKKNKKNAKKSKKQGSGCSPSVSSPVLS
ncbi:hypothetical protein V6N13_090034 [Hibiscus sabdariffa]